MDDELWVLGYRWWIMDDEFGMMNYGWWIIDDELWMMNYGCWVMDDEIWWWNMDDELWVMSYGWWIMDDGLWMMNYGWRIMDDGLWMMNYGCWILGWWIIDDHGTSPQRNTMFGKKQLKCKCWGPSDANPELHPGYICCKFLMYARNNQKEQPDALENVQQSVACLTMIHELAV
jgi:hypothetical protein